ncbi:MAG: acetolactate synthase [Phycisphaerae bacterium]
MEIQPFETMEAHDDPTVRQQSVFVENRVGQLLRLTRLFTQTDLRILAVSVVYSVDCAIARMILDDPDRGYELLRDANFQISETELLVVSLPHGKRALLDTWAALLGGEVSIHYTYPLLARPKGHAAIAVLPDNIEQAVSTLRAKQFEILDQNTLRNCWFE